VERSIPLFEGVDKEGGDALTERSLHETGVLDSSKSNMKEAIEKELEKVRQYRKLNQYGGTYDNQGI